MLPECFTISALQTCWIDSNDALKSACESCQQASAVAVDTEFMRRDTFYPIAGLVQLYAGDIVYLIDPLAIDEWQPLADLLQNPDCLKVLHACNEDLEVFSRLTGTAVNSLFDTQLAASLLGLGHCVGYQKLLESQLEIELDKSETRSDWLQRPLTSSQLGYAALDVHYLLPLYEKLRQQLEQQNRLEWLLEEGRRLAANSTAETNPEEAWRQVKLAWKLRPQQLAILKVLCNWREKEARRLDVPRNQLIPAGALWELARYQPKNIQSLSRAQKMTPTLVRRHGKHILMLIEQGKNLPRSEWPAALPLPLPKNAKPWAEAASRCLEKRAEELNVSREILISRADLKALLQTAFDSNDYPLLPSLSGWRRREVYEPLVKTLTATRPDFS
ncbi:ribonuclease D [Spongorhabdus nitratireducens]